MKTRLAIIAALATSSLLAGCSSTAPGDAPAASGAANGQDSGIRVAFVSQVEGIPYFSGFNVGADRAAEEFGVTYDQAGPAKADSAEQKRIVDGLIAQNYDAIAISPLDPTSMNGAISDAIEAGIAVATSDADAPDSDRQVFVSQASDEELGAAVMDELAAAMGESGQYAIVSGAPDVATFNNWVAAAQAQRDALYPDMELVGDIRHTTDSAEALREAQNLITAYPELKGIIAVPSTAVPGVAQAVQNADQIGQIAVTGFGSPKTAGTFLESGAMTSTVLWDVEDLGYLTVWALVQMVEGNEFAETNDVPGLDEPVRYDSATGTLLLGTPTVFNKSNYADFDF